MNGASPSVYLNMDVRRCNWRQVLGLRRRTPLYWDNVRTVEVQELPALLVPVRYRVLCGDGWYREQYGKRHYFGVVEHLEGLDLKRGVTIVALRAAVVLAVVGGIGLRQLAWLLAALFGLE
jgi:hypothetical protein